jgi:hypothetical protein
MEIEEIIIAASITIFSLGLLIVSFLSYKKYRKLRLLFISIVFTVFLIKGILSTLLIFGVEVPLVPSLLHGTYSGLFDVIILILLFVATLKR